MTISRGSQCTALMWLDKCNKVWHLKNRFLQARTLQLAALQLHEMSSVSTEEFCNRSSRKVHCLKFPRFFAVPAKKADKGWRTFLAESGPFFPNTCLLNVKDNSFCCCCCCCCCGRCSGTRLFATAISENGLPTAFLVPQLLDLCCGDPKGFVWFLAFTWSAELLSLTCQSLPGLCELYVVQ